MMFTIKNIKQTSYTINLTKSKLFGSLKVDHLIPNLVQEKIDFEIINSNEALVNGIRRCLLGEFNVKYLHVDISDIISNDDSVLTNKLQQRIAGIPINQDININTKFNLNVSNDTLKKMPVYSKDITGKDKNIFNNTIVLHSLNINKHLIINNIIIKEAINGNVSPCRACFDTINIDKNESCLTTIHKDFYFTVHTFGNISPKKIINIGCHSLINRLEYLKNIILNYDQMIQNDLIKVNEFGISKYIIYNEDKHTIGNLLVKYIFLQDQSIGFVCYTFQHETEAEFVVKIKSINAEKYILKAIDNIIIDLKKFNSYFK